MVFTNNAAEQMLMSINQGSPKASTGRTHILQYIKEACADMHSARMSYSRGGPRAVPLALAQLANNFVGGVASKGF